MLCLGEDCFVKGSFACVIPDGLCDLSLCLLGVQCLTVRGRGCEIH